MFTMLAYLAEGAAGLPVFAPAHGLTGVTHILGPTGGYLMAYPTMAVVLPTSGAPASDLSSARWSVRAQVT